MEYLIWDTPKINFVPGMEIMNLWLCHLNRQNALVVFVDWMNHNFSHCVDFSVVTFIDKILLYYELKIKYDHYLRIILNELREIVWECVFSLEDKLFWGSFCTWIVINHSKLEAVEHWNRITTVIEVRSFLESAKYYWRFIEGFSKILTLFVVN